MGTDSWLSWMRVPVMFDAARKRIIEVKGLASRVAAKSPPVLRPVVVENARTRRGNVPLFKGAPKWSADLPITVTATGNQIVIRAVDWSMRRMLAKGSPREWVAAVGDVARSILEGK